MPGQTYQTTDQYFADFPKASQELMQLMRNEIQATAPDAEEVITYNMPGFKLNGKYLVAYAAYKHHIGFYPGSDAIEHFKKDISKYKWAKGSVQFPIDQEIPLSLIRKITKFRASAIISG